MLTFGGLSPASRATTLTYRMGSAVSTKFRGTLRLALVSHPPRQDYPTSFRDRAKPTGLYSLGGVPSVPVGRLAFRAPAGKKNIRGGRSRRQIKRRGSRTLALGPSQAFAQKPRSQAVRTVPPSPQIRSGPPAGAPGRADHCCRLVSGCTRVTPAGNISFSETSSQVRTGGAVRRGAAQGRPGPRDRPAEPGHAGFGNPTGTLSLFK